MGYPDASAIEAAVENLDVRPTAEAETTDAAVLDSARRADVLLTNDQALGRRAANYGVRWLRTADLVMLCVETGVLEVDRARTALEALSDAGRLTEELLEDYREELS